MDKNMKNENYLEVIEEPISIEVTSHCNSDCLHCFSRGRNSQPCSLPIGLVKNFITEGYNTGYRHLHITGGEPLLWDGLFETMDFTFNAGYQTVFLNTNGTGLTKDVSSKLSAYRGLSLSVSLEGTESIHNHLRGNGSYKRTATGIENALDAGIELVIFTIACKSVLPALPNVVDDLYRRFSSLKHLTLIQLFSVTDNLYALSEELLEPEDFLQLIRTVSLLNLLGHKTSLLNNPLADVVSKLLEVPWIPRSHPLYRNGSMIVMANRDICLSHSSTDSFGKYEFGMIQKVMASAEYQKAVAPDKMTCPSCNFHELCTENEMVRPSEWCWDTNPEILYCKRVLDSVVPGY